MLQIGKHVLNPPNNKDTWKRITRWEADHMLSLCT